MSYYPNIFTVTFIGHAEYDNFEEVEVKLKKEIEKILLKHDAVIFLIGRWGGFNISAAYWVRYLKEKYRDSFIQLLLKIPSEPLYFIDERTPYEVSRNTQTPNETNGKTRSSYKTKTEADYRYSERPNNDAKMLANHQYLIDNSDYIICCLQRDKGITYKTIQYAKSKKKKIKNVGTNAKNDPIKLMK